MIRQFRTSGFTPKGGPGLHTLVALCTSTSISAGLAGYGLKKEGVKKAFWF